MEQRKEKAIIIMRNGPYKVSGVIPLKQDVIECDLEGAAGSWKTGKAYHVNGEYHLCRCGMAHKKPFCDGSHKKTGFVGREKADQPSYQKNAEFLRGPGLGLLDDESLCIGARFCDGKGTIWRRLSSTRDPKVRDEVLEEACKCPSGRLTAVTGDGRLLEPGLPQEISLIQDPFNNCRGPLWVKGGIPVKGEAGEMYEIRNRVTLCRCGKSENMPYCDASHYTYSQMQGLDE